MQEFPTDSFVSYWQVSQGGTRVWPAEDRMELPLRVCVSIWFFIFQVFILAIETLRRLIRRYPELLTGGLKGAPN